uniref:NADH dehydrogenase subunit 6 n=1 Tax=Eucallipterus tiliae TaxID=527681 RepID=A0A1L1YM91_9HEMI|nr:NADH dehydrogenase subunit 6 [Eucallipterus tiliae]
MIKIIILLNILLSITLINMKSPLSSNLIILLQSILLTMMINLIMKTSWISFMLFILYISGLMIIFLYISSIAFNELNINKNYMTSLTKMLLISLLFFMIKLMLPLEMFKYENNFNYEDNYYIMNMMNMPNNLMIYFIMLILFFMLILIIWLLKNNKGPMRQKLN